MKFHILVFGCQMNYADSARIKAVLTNIGFSHTDDIQDADIIIFDTCSVRQKSEDKVTGKLLEIKPTQKVWLTGCMIQHNLKNLTGNKKFAQGNFLNHREETDEILIVGRTNEFPKTSKKIIPINHAFNPMFHRLNSSFSNVELFFRIDDLSHLPQILRHLGYQTPDIELGVDYLNIYSTLSNKQQKSSRTVYVPIQTGCNQFCSYCIVPYARGLEKNRPADEVIREIEHHLAQGVKEIVLLGQIVNKHPEFVSIVRRALSLTGLEWLRYTSPYPTFYHEDLLSLHQNEEKLCPHIHAPVQSGSDSILKKMFRGYTVDQYKKFVDKIRGLTRNISLTTDIIVGFPDETEDDFRGTLELANYAKFDMIYMGIYSPRPGTYAYKKFLDTVPPKEKQARWQRLNTVLTQNSLINNKIDVGQTQRVMVTHIDEMAIGYNEQMKTVAFTHKNPQIGDIVTVDITNCVPLKLIGQQ